MKHLNITVAVREDYETLASEERTLELGQEFHDDHVRVLGQEVVRDIVLNISEEVRERLAEKAAARVEKEGKIDEVPF